MPLIVIGYTSGVVLAFSTSTPTTRRSIAARVCQRGAGLAGVAVVSGGLDMARGAVRGVQVLGSGRLGGSGRECRPRQVEAEQVVPGLIQEHQGPVDRHRPQTTLRGRFHQTHAAELVASVGNFEIDADAGLFAEE